MTLNPLVLILFFIGNFSSHFTMAATSSQTTSMGVYTSPDGNFHLVEAEIGDNIYIFLQRYHLEKYKCNFDRFFQLNNLNKTSHLIAGNKYYIPVRIYTYNGKSIRTTLKIDTWEQALRIKKYNEKIRAEGLRKKSIAASNILWVPYHEQHCVDGRSGDPLPQREPTTPKQEDLNQLTPLANAPKEDPAQNEQQATVQHEKINPKILAELNKNSGVRKYPIFGPKHAYVQLLNNSLRGKVFYIVGGHGGPDSGAIGKAGNRRLYEDEYAYDVALRLTRQLLQRGALVYMITRDPDDGLRSGKYLKADMDEYCWPHFVIPRSQKPRLFQRSNAVNKLYEKHLAQGIKEQYCVAIHIDSRSTSENTDVFFYYFPGSADGKKLALNIHKTFKEKYKIHRKNGRYHGTVTARDLHMLREPKPTSVFIELGNIRNASDQRRFVEASNREALAKWLYEGLVRK